MAIAKAGGLDREQQERIAGREILFIQQVVSDRDFYGTGKSFSKNPMDAVT